MSRERGTVKVAGGRYRPAGDFHIIYPNTQVRDESGKLLGVTNPRDMTYIHSYGGEAPFFAALAEGRLLATRCDNAACEAHGSVFIPYRIHCPDCLARMTDVDITEIARRSATVHSFMVTERTGAFNTLPKPIKFINIEFEGVCTILMGYFSLGEPEIGLRVAPIFNTGAPTSTIIDLSWVPEGTPETDLPDGFTFG